MKPPMVTISGKELIEAPNVHDIMVESFEKVDSMVMEVLSQIEHSGVVAHICWTDGVGTWRWDKAIWIGLTSHEEWVSLDTPLPLELPPVVPLADAAAMG